MGARMMSGHTSMHEELESKLASFVSKESAYLLILDIKEFYQQLTL